VAPSDDTALVRPRPGDLLEVTVEKGVYRGLGLARHGGQIVFVPRGLPQDRLRVEIGSSTRGYLRASLREILAPSPERRVAPCAHAERCGGCAYQDLAYPAQLQLKEAILRESLERAGVAWSGAIPLTPSPEVGWRMRCAFHVALAETRRQVRLGLHEEGSRRLVDVERCLQVSERVGMALRQAAAGLARRPGFVPRIRALHAAESPEGDALVLSIEGALEAREAAGLTSILDVPGLSGLGVMLGHSRYMSLRGSPYVESRVLGRRLRSHALSFFQVNRFLVEPLARAVVDATPAGGRVIDLYAGVGLFAVSLAARAEEVVAVEMAGTAAEDATANVRAAGLENVRVQRGDVLQALGAWRPQRDERVVLDPPRTGAGPAVVEAVSARHPEAIVYVSCDPPTLARDLKAFEGHGYVVDSVVAFDMFPDTFHLETVVRLRPR
jgi:23S rRNA (uracil1939-C5)-methyltransferase